MARTSASGSYEMSLPRAGAYSVQYRDCSPGKASVAVTARRQVQVGTSPITALPATLLGRPGKATGAEFSATAGVMTPNNRRVILAPPGEVIENGKARPETSSNASTAVITGRVTGPSGRPLASICMWIVGKTFAAGTCTGGVSDYAQTWYPHAAARSMAAFVCLAPAERPLRPQAQACLGWKLDRMGTWPRAR